MMSDRDCLEQFVARVERLEACAYVLSPTPAHWSLKWQRGKQLVVTTAEPSEEVLKSFLVDLRPFLSKKEPVYLGRVYNICERRLSDGKLKEWLRKSRQQWKDTQAHSGIRLSVHGHDYQPEEITDLWLNGWYFHSEPAKLAELKRLGTTALRLERMEFLHFIDRTLQHVVYTRNVVKAALKEGHLRLE